MDERRSTSGHFLVHGGSQIVWSSKKQLVVAHTVEEQFYGLANSFNDILCLKSFLTEICVILPSPQVI